MAKGQKKGKRKTKKAPPSNDQSETRDEFFISTKPTDAVIKESSEGASVEAENTHQEAYPKRNQDSDTAEGRTLFIRNVPFEADDESLHQFLSSFGELELAKIVRDKMTNHPRGTAFAKFVRKEDVDNILLKFSKSYVSFDLLTFFIHVKFIQIIVSVY